MFNVDPKKSLNNPPSELIKEAVRLWGKPVNKLAWELTELGESNQADGRIKAFHCPKNDVCELIELHNLKFQENGRNVKYGIGRCLSCAKIYWGKIDQDFTD